MSFFDELKRRNVIRVGIAYAAIAWLLAQIADLAFGAFGVPDWTLRALLIALLVGFPVALVIAWVYELTPDGVRVDEDGDSDTPPGADRRFDRIIIGVLAVAVTVLLVERFYINETMSVVETQSIAILPFVNLSDDNDHFADGLSEELLNVLARNRSLQVVGRTSSFAFKGRNEDLREIGNALGVDHLLEGSVRRAGDRLRITAQLIKVDDGFHVWSQTYDRHLADVFEIQDDVTREIASALEVRLIPDADRPTNNVEAYAFYLEALAMSDFPDGEIGEALGLLNRALELDPEFAKAHLLKAMAYWQAAGWTIENDVAQPLVYRSATAALNLDPTLLTARPFIVSANPVETSWLDYVEALEAAIEYDPNNFRLLDTISNTYLMTGYYEKSLYYAQIMVELEPLSSYSFDRVGFAQNALGQRDEAHAAWARAFELGSIDSLGLIGWDHLVAGEYDEYVEKSEAWYRESGMNVPDERQFLDSVVDPVNGKEFLDDWLKEETARSTNNGDVGGPWFAYNWYVYLGYIDDAWAIIKKENAETQSTWKNSDGIRFAGIVFPGTGFRRHPDYIEPDLVELWEAHGKPDMCDKIDDEWVCE